MRLRALAVTRVVLPDRMQVAACRADGSLAVEQRPRPTPGTGEVLLAMRACGLCGTDLFKLANRRVEVGEVLGHELVGEVAAVGPEVATAAVGDRVVVPHHVACGRCPLCRRGAATMCAEFKRNVMMPGGFAEFLVIGARAVETAMRPVPSGVGDAAASFLEPAACVLRGIDKAELRTEDGCAVVLGAGSMGLLHLLVLHAVRPGLRVVVSDPEPTRRRLAVQLGAVSAVPPAELAQAVGAASDGIGADAVFDTVGGAGPLGESLRVLRPGGSAVLFAHGDDGETADFVLNDAFRRELRIVATYSGTLAEQDRVAALVFSGRLDASCLVTHRLPLSRAAEGIELARRRQALKILLTPERA